MSNYQLALDVISNHHEPIEFRHYYEDMAGTKMVPDVFLYRPDYWKDLDQNKGVDILIRQKRTNVLSWVVGRQTEWNNVSKENEEKIVQYFIKNKIDLFGVPLIMRERVKNARMKGEAQKLPSNPFKLKESTKDLKDIESVKKYNKEELLRACRLAMDAEHDAINQYTITAEACGIPSVRKVFESVANEEKVHAGEFLKLIEKLSKEEIDLYDKGKEEAKSIKENRMNNLRDYLDDKENKEFDEQLDENILGTIGTILGYTISGALLAFGGTLLVIGGKKYVLKMKDLWKNILGKRKQEPGKEAETPEQIMKNIETDAKVKAERIKIEEKKRAFEDKLTGVYSAIEEKDFDKAKQEFYNVDRNLQNNPDVHKAIILEIAKVLKEPPLYVKSPGNNSYQAIKKIINIRVARASAKATEMALTNEIV